MANWVYIESGAIKEYHDKLPRSWRNVSGLDKASSSLLRSLGWFPVEDEPVTVDIDNFEVDGIDYTILSDKVKQKVRLKRITSAKKTEQQEKQRLDFFNALRSERNRRLSECDWTQLFDVQTIRTKTWKDKWSVYRQELRELPQLYKDTTNYSIDSVIWPIVPEAIERQ